MADEKKNTGKESNDVVGSFYEEKGAESAANLRNGKDVVTFSIANKIKVEFTKDFVFMKKGNVQEVSEIAYEIYKKAEVVKKL